MIAPIRKGMKIRNQSLCFLLGVSSSVSSDASASSVTSVVCFFAETAVSFFFSPMLICLGAPFFFERRISMKMQNPSIRAHTMTMGIQRLLIMPANPELLEEERDGNEPPLPFLKFEGSKFPFWKLEGSKSPFWKLEGSKSPLPKFDGSKPSGMLAGSKFSESKSPPKPPGKLPDPPPGKPDESDELKPGGMLPRPELPDLDGRANLRTIVAIMRIVNTIRTIV